MHAGDNRALAWAALASLALHLLLVVGWPRVQERLRPAPAPPIVSRLVEPPAPEPPRSAEAAPAPKAPVEKKQRIEKPVARPVERGREPQPAPREEVAQAKPQPAEQAPASPAAAPIPAPAGPAVASVAPPQPAQPQADVATTIAQYRMQVLGAARRLKSRYPDIARENNWSGAVVLSLLVGADGGADVKLKSGTGHGPLDEQASEMFRQAARSVPVPPALQGRAFSVELKAVYGLVD